MFEICSGLDSHRFRHYNVYRKLYVVYCSFLQLIVCAAMYKLTPQYIVSYDQVNTCFLHVREKEGRGMELEVDVGGGGVIVGRVSFHRAFFPEFRVHICRVCRLLNSFGFK